MFNRVARNFFIGRSKADEDRVSRQKPVLIFLHIPKTGGTTLNKILEREVLPARRYHLHNFMTTANQPESGMCQFLALSQQERDQFDLLYGHIAMGVHRFLSRPCVYIALLRDPLRRNVSSYFQSAKNKDNHYYEAIKSGELTLEKFLIGSGPNNQVIRRLHGCNLFDREWYGQDGKVLWEELQKEIDWIFWESKVTPEMLEEAKANLRDHFMLVGTTERFSDFIFLLFRKLGWGAVPYCRRENQSFLSKKTVEELHPDIVSGFMENSKYEQALYAYAKRLFEQQWSQLGALEKSRAYCNRLKQRCYQGLKKVAAPFQR